MVPKQPKRLVKRLIWVAAGIAIAVGVVIAGPAVHIRVASAGREYAAADVPERDVAIVLGARVYADGTPSPFLRQRLDLGVELFKAGKVRAILVSGANTPASFYETDVMRAYAVAAGVPAEKVVADPGGYDTFDTCVRARKVFGVTSATLVSQGYHLPRALTLCKSVGIDAVGVGDYAPRGTSPFWREGELREWFAGPKVELDLLFGDTRDPYDPALDRALER